MDNIFKSALQFIAVSSLVVAFSHPGMASEESKPQVKEVAIGLSEVYIPGGFDSSTDAYVVASGLFPNGCYQWKGAEVRHLDTFEHEVQSYANVSQGLCIMVMVPFSKEIRVGKMASGTHKLKFLNGDGTYLEKTMRVE